MQPASFPARQTRTHYRHELRTLTYVTLDEANGGIIRNLSHEGVAVQAVGRLQQDQRVRLRFELRFPRLRLEATGRVSWTSDTGRCGIRFVDLPTRTRRQIDEWVFSNLLDTAAVDASNPRSIFGSSVVPIAPEDEGSALIISAKPRPAIQLKSSIGELSEATGLAYWEDDPAEIAHDHDAQLNWLSRPLSSRTLAWMVDSLVITAGLLLFAFIFLSIAHELPQWQLTLSGALAAVVFVAASYWTVFALFGGPSLGARLAQAATSVEQEAETDSERRFR